jgi:hypothetical protein
MIALKPSGTAREVMAITPKSLETLQALLLSDRKSSTLSEWEENNGWKGGE